MLKRGLLIIGLFLSHSVQAQVSETIPLIINFPIMCEMGKEAYFNDDYWTNIKVPIHSVEKIELHNYVGDSILITPDDCPNLKSLTIDATSAAVEIKGISKFQTLKEFECRMGKLSTVNINEVYECKNLERLTIYSRYFPIEISPQILKLKKLKYCYVWMAVNPEILYCQHKNRKSFLENQNDFTDYHNWCMTTRYSFYESDIVLWCKMNGLTKEQVNALDSSLLEKYDYSFSVDSSFSIYYKNYKDYYKYKEGYLACSGTLRNGHRVGKWIYNQPLSTEVIQYDERGKFIKNETYFYDLDSNFFNRDTSQYPGSVVSLYLNPKNTEIRINEIYQLNIGCDSNNIVRINDTATSTFYYTTWSNFPLIMDLKNKYEFRVNVFYDQYPEQDTMITTYEIWNSFYPWTKRYMYLETIEGKLRYNYNDFLDKEILSVYGLKNFEELCEMIYKKYERFLELYDEFKM